MLNYFGAVDSKPSDCWLMGIECDSKRLPISELYTRSGVLPLNADVRMNDMCSFSIATQGFQAKSVNVGEAWIIYDVELFMPIQTQPGSTMLGAEYNLSLTSVVDPPINDPTRGFFGATATQTQMAVYDNIGLIFGYDSVSAVSYIGITDKRSIPSNSSFVISYLINGSLTDDVGHPYLGAVPGVTTQNVYTCPRGPLVASTVPQSCISLTINIPDTSQLVPAIATAVYPLAVAGSNPVTLCAFIPTQTPDATVSVPNSPDSYCVLRVLQINGTSLLA